RDNSRRESKYDPGDPREGRVDVQPLGGSAADAGQEAIGSGPVEALAHRPMVSLKRTGPVALLSVPAPAAILRRPAAAPGALTDPRPRHLPGRRRHARHRAERRVARQSAL